MSDERFRFGANWLRFLEVVDEDRIAAAVQSLQTMLGVERLDGRRFLDVGCGSGLFSLAAHRLGAAVHSLDYGRSRWPVRRRCSGGLRSPKPRG